MALRSKFAIHPKWVFHNRAAAESLSLATIEIYNENSDGKQYDAATNTWTGDRTVLYTGKARVQPTTGQQEIGSTFNPTTIQQARIFVPYNANTLEDSNGVVPVINANDKIIITSSPYDATLEGFIFTVISPMNSSNPWEKGLLCRADVELDRSATE